MSRCEYETLRNKRNESETVRAQCCFFEISNCMNFSIYSNSFLSFPPFHTTDTCKTIIRSNNFKCLLILYGKRRRVSKKKYFVTIFFLFYFVLVPFFFLSLSLSLFRTTKTGYLQKYTRTGI